MAFKADCGASTVLVWPAKREQPGPPCRDNAMSHALAAVRHRTRLGHDVAQIAEPEAGRARVTQNSKLRTQNWMGWLGGKSEIRNPKSRWRGWAAFRIPNSNRLGAYATVQV